MPTIALGGILQMFIVDITFTYTMSLNNNVLELLAGDYDGDVVNLHYIINRAFFEAAYRELNPRNSLIISRNDGKVNMNIIWSKDTLINSNSMIYLSRKNYSQEQIERIRKAQQME